jgi:hypothetical protein
MMEGIAAASIAYNQLHTSTRLAAHAAKRATESAMCRRSQEVWSIVLMAKTSGDSTLGVSGIILSRFFGGFRTRLRLRDISPKGPWPLCSGRNGRFYRCNPKPPSALGYFSGAKAMPYALFCNEAKLSKAYPTEADVWKQARQSGLVVDVATEEEKAAPRPVLDNDYEIKPCRPDPQEDPARNQADAEREAGLEFQLQP